MSGFEELFEFRAYRTLTGKVESVGLYKRNGKLAVGFRDVDTAEVASKNDEWPALYEHLTDVERSTWAQLLNGRSTSQIAEDEGVSRAAVYFRIRGRDGKSGMVAKNRWVRLWWSCKQST